MQIVHCIYSLNIGGTETMLVDILNEQVKTQDVSLIIINNVFSENLLQKIDKKVNIFLLNRKPKKRCLFFILKLNWILFRLHPDVIHIHTPSLSSIILPVFNSKFFLTVHDLQKSMKCVSSRTHVIAISDAVKNAILKQGNYDVTVISNGINIDMIETKNSHVLDKNKPMRIIQVARLNTSLKGQDILISAISILKKRGITNVEVDFIGEGESEQMLKEYAKAQNVRSQVHFLGLRDRTYIYSHLKDYDLMCHPARFEGFGLVIVEAMAAMLPVLVPNIGGPYEVVKEGKFGNVFCSESAIDCAEKIEYIYLNYNNLYSVVANAKDYVTREYTMHSMVNKYIQLYQRL